MSITRKWRKTSQTLNGRPYWSLQAGARGEDRVALALGHVTEMEADRALQTMQREEDTLFGTRHYDRVLRMYRGEIPMASDDADPEYVPDGSAPTPSVRARSPKQRAQDAARAFLIGTTSIEALFPTKTPPIEHKNLRLRDYFKEVYEPARSLAKPVSWRVERQSWERILSGMGDTKLGDVDEYVVDAYLSGLMKLNGEASTWNMKRQHRNAITALLTFARRKRHYPHAMPTWFRLEGSTETTFEAQVGLSLDQLRTLLSACGPQLRAIVAVGAGLGLRPNEITVLRAEDLLWDAPTPYPGITGILKVRGTKTEGSAATVPLLPIARAEIRAWWEALGCPSEGLLFKPQKAGASGASEYQADGGHVAWRKALETAVKRSGLGVRVTPYTLRHTAATLLIESGVPMNSVAKILRHSNPRMLEKHYDHTGAVRAPGLDRAPHLE